MSVKAKVEAIIYATEEPVTLNQLAALLKEPVLAEIQAEEELRLALNETVSDGKPEVEEEDDSFEIVEEVEPEPAADVPTETSEQAPAAETAAVAELPATEDKPADAEKDQARRIKAYLSEVLDELIADYASAGHGVEVRQVAGGYRMGTKPEHHDVVIGFAKSLKPPVRLSLQALETLAVIAYKQPITVPEISEIRGVDSAGVIATLLDRKLVTTAGRKQVIGRPILYKTTKEFLLRFGLNNVGELPSMEEFEKLGDPQAELFPAPAEGSPESGGTPAPEPEREPEGTAEGSMDVTPVESAPASDETPAAAEAVKETES